MNLLQKEVGRDESESSQWVFSQYKMSVNE